MHRAAIVISTLALAACATDPVSMRAQGPAVPPTTYAMPYLQLARCAAREYSAMPTGLMAALTGYLREFPDDGYVEVLATAAAPMAMAEFRRVREDLTEVRIYQGQALSIGFLAARMNDVHRDCAEGRRTGQPDRR